MPTIHRFHVEIPTLSEAGLELPLPGHVAHQAGAVLRLRPGDPIVLFDGRGGEWQAEVVRLGRGHGEARLVQFNDVDREAPLRLTLCLALIKADRFEWALQKGTELGVAAFQPLLTRRVTAASSKGSPGQREREHLIKAERWRRIVIEAAEQSERTMVPPVHAPRALRTVLAAGSPAVFCWEGAETPPSLTVAGAIDVAMQAAGARSSGIQVLIGPEGGFTPDEAEAARDAGAIIASLGPRILRSETAAVAAAAVALLGHAE